MGSRCDATHNLKQLHDLVNLDKQAVEGEVLPVVDSAYRAREVLVFSNEGENTDRYPWPELSEPYRRYKKRMRPGRKILVWDGNMRAAFTTTNTDHVAYAFAIQGRWTLLIGGRGPSWWRSHAEGIPPMPKRDPQQSGPLLYREMQAAIRRALIPRINRLGKAFVTAMRVRRQGA